MGKKQPKIKEFGRAVKMEVREHKSSFIAFCIIRILIVLCMIRQFIHQDYEGFFLCIMALLLLLLPSIMQVRLKVEVPAVLEILILVFIYSSEILGEVNEFYVLIPGWDTLLHTLNGFLAAGVGLSLAYLLNKSDKITFDLSPAFLAVVAFCFSMTIGVCWEFFECFMDIVFGTDMQKDTIIHTISSVALNPDGVNTPFVIKHITETTVNGSDLNIDGYLDIGLLDTMKDLFVNFIGAVCFSVMGFFWLRSDGRENKVVKDFVLSKKNTDTDFMEKAIEDDMAKEWIETEANTEGNDDMPPI